MPNYISGTDRGRDGIDVFSFGSAYLGPATHPFSLPGDPSDPAFTVRNVSVTPEVGTASPSARSCSAASNGHWPAATRPAPRRRWTSSSSGP